MISFGSCSSFNSGSASSSRVLILLIVNVFGMFLSSTHATCYLPNGTDINLGYRSSPYIPCKSSSISEHSMCCWAGMDKCLSNGLCYYAGHTYRAACTDPTWKSSSCVKLCSSGSGTALNGDLIDNLADTYAAVSPCGDGSYCCGNRARADQYCGRKKGTFMIDGEPAFREAKSSSALDVVSSSSIKATPSSSSSTALLTISQSFSALPSTASASPSATAKLSCQIGMIAKAALGGMAAMAFMTGIVVLVWIYCKKRRARSHGTLQATWEEDGTRRQDHKAHGFMKNKATYHKLAITEPLLEVEDSVKKLESGCQS